MRIYTSVIVVPDESDILNITDAQLEWLIGNGLAQLGFRVYNIQTERTAVELAEGVLNGVHTEIADLVRERYTRVRSGLVNNLIEQDRYIRGRRQQQRERKQRVQQTQRNYEQHEAIKSSGR